MKRNLIATEEQEQIALMNWAKFHPICKEYLIHIPNERKCSPQYGLKLKSLGVKKGISDLFLAYPKFRYAGLWIELKKRKLSTVTKSQKEWIDKMNNLGYKAVVCYGWEEAKEVIDDYLNLDVFK
jgi:VRR-NUC domain